MCIIPKPPDFAIAIAILDSVTVSMAEDNRGIFNLRFLLNSVFVIVSWGRIDEYCGTSVTSSNVNDTLIAPIFHYKHFF